MKWPSLNLILMNLFLTYIIYSIYNLSELFVVPSCEDDKSCFTSYLSDKPRLKLQIYSSVNRYPSDREFDLVYSMDDFNYTHESSFPLTLNIPRKTRQNGTLFLYVIVLPHSKTRQKSFSEVRKDSFMRHTIIEMTQYAIPEAEAFNLLGNKELNVKNNKQSVVQPVTHLKSKVTFTIMTDDVKLPVQNLPMELVNQLKIITHGNTFLPMINCNSLQTRHRDLVRITPQNDTINVTVLYSPISLGKLRLNLHFEYTMMSFKNLGFSDKEVDEAKGIFADVNIYLLGGTFFITTLHMLFDFLALTNDVSFWRQKNNLVGLSKWTVIWRGFSQTVIFFYLLDEGASLLVLISTGIGCVIEIWKLKKVLMLRFYKNTNTAEIRTRQFDAESMRYLGYVLYPLIVGCAIYSLLYQSHRSWYSWIIHSLVNGIYACGFLFMLPQLFVNYKLKSVAHLPWRTFMYKAFNTFIDDVFAFIITMPTAHRIACFRDDVVFLIYLYQTWLYPVDKSRTDGGSLTEESVDFGGSSKKSN